MLVAALKVAFSQKTIFFLLCYCVLTLQAIAIQKGNFSINELSYYNLKFVKCTSIYLQVLKGVFIIECVNTNQWLYFSFLNNISTFRVIRATNFRDLPNTFVLFIPNHLWMNRPTVYTVLWFLNCTINWAFPSILGDFTTKICCIQMCYKTQNLVSSKCQASKPL